MPNSLAAFEKKDQGNREVKDSRPVAISETSTNSIVSSNRNCKGQSRLFKQRVCSKWVNMGVFVWQRNIYRVNFEG